MEMAPTRRQQRTSSEMFLVLFLVLVLLILPYVVGMFVNSDCALRIQTLDQHFKDGDVIIGGLVTVRISTMDNTNPFDIPPEYNKLCRVLKLKNYQNLLAFVFAINEINRDPELLANTSIGFYISDTCLNEEKSTLGAINMLFGKSSSIPNFRCEHSRNIVAFVDDFLPKLHSTWPEYSGCTRYHRSATPRWIRS
ncbi:vomeronasal type-2 receptor 26-like [Ascaphus truei]|uniref:vomeronasal type-2 receptor 26-like n=1 Tax=Ascaphus truei TaxID=8439 RepID=UPI003F59B6C1